MPTPAPAASAAVSAWIGTWSRPPDRPAQVALAAAGTLLVLAVVPGGPAWIASTLEFASLGDPARKRRFLTVASFVAAFLSLGYIAFYLRGGPRAADAPALWLQGRALSHGELAWTAPDPTASFRARSLLFGAPDRLAGIAPPGYPLLLAAGFLVGAPMLVGPLLAAALVVATWLLTREIAESAGERGARVEAIARVAVGLSIVSAALRYDTADAVPHGAAAVALSMAFACALRARRIRDARLFGLAGLATGWLAATQPLSAIPVGAVIVALASRDAQHARAVAWTCAGALPGAVLLLAARHAATGHALASPEAGYLAGVGPPGVAHLPPLEAVLAILRGVRVHALDIANLEPVALLALVPVFGRHKARAAMLAALVVAGELLVHALVALALACLFPGGLARAAVATLALALAGFAVHAAHDHERVAAADLGRPRFEPDVAREGNVAYGLLFFDDDDGYELASDPAALASHGVEAVRMRGDDHDRLLYDLLGHPPTHRYLSSGAAASVTPWTPPGGSSDTWRFEAESDWPPAAHAGAWAVVEDPHAPCASDGHVLAVSPSGGQGDGAVTLALPIPRNPTTATSDKRTWMVTPRVVSRGGAGEGTLELRTDEEGPPRASWSWSDQGKVPTCNDLPAQPVELSAEHERAWLVVRARGGSVALDKTTLRPR